jgi:hypothetical protein
MHSAESYSCGDDDYLIDVAKKRWDRLEWYALGDGFEAAVKRDDNGASRIRHDGKVIGEWIMNPYWAKTAVGRIAFEYVTPGGNLGEPDGVALWEAATGRWQTVKFWSKSLIGWAAVGAGKPE